MQEFPFTADEWNTVQEVTHALTNAVLADDPIVGAMYFNELQQVLAALRGKYGDHPVLLETETDFCDDDETRPHLYETALAIAVRHSNPSYTIRLELAELALNHGDLSVADEHLTASRDEVLSLADEFDRQRWQDLRNAVQAARCESPPS